MKNFLFFLFFHFFLFISPSLIQAAGYSSPAEMVGLKAYEWFSRTSYFKTKSHRDKNGNEVVLAPRESFTRFEEELGLRYGIKRDFEVELSGRFRSQENIVDDTTKGYHELSAEGMESVFVGAKYSLTQNSQQVASVRAYVRSALTSGEAYLASVPYQTLDLGDEGREMGLGLVFTQKSVGKPWLTGGITYQYRSEDFSQEILYQVEGALKKKNWGVVAGIEGLYSLKTDPYEEDPLGRPGKNVGTTQLYNAINRSWLKPYGGLLVSLFKKGQIALTYKKTMTGVSTDIGDEFYLDLKWKTDGIQDETIKEQSFKEYEIEATVTKVSPREIFVKIDRGYVDDLAKGMIIDLYQFDYLGGNILVARGSIYQLETNTSVVKIEKKYKEIPLKIGFVARGNYP